MPYQANSDMPAALMHRCNSPQQFSLKCQGTEGNPLAVATGCSWSVMALYSTAGPLSSPRNPQLLHFFHSSHNAIAPGMQGRQTGCSDGRLRVTEDWITSTILELMTLTVSSDFTLADSLQSLYASQFQPAYKMRAAQPTWTPDCG